LINRKKIMRMCGSSEKEGGGGGVFGKMADGQEKEKERERAQRWKKVEREKERKGFRHQNPCSNPDHIPKIPTLLDINSNLVFQFSLLPRHKNIPPSLIFTINTPLPAWSPPSREKHPYQKITRIHSRYSITSQRGEMNGSLVQGQKFRVRVYGICSL